LRNARLGVQEGSARRGGNHAFKEVDEEDKENQW
jgi:hypothetical protein